MGKDEKADIVIFDVEGSDSKERWEERNVYLILKFFKKYFRFMSKVLHYLH